MNQEIAEIKRDVAEIKEMLRKLVSPATALSVHEKAAAIRKALDTGDKAILKQTMRELNGE